MLVGLILNICVGTNGAYRARETVPKDTQTIDVQPISVSALQVDELKDITDNFGTKALIGEGSYGRVYHGILKTGQAAAIKKLDSSKQPDQEFLAQVCNNCRYFLFQFLLAKTIGI